MKKGNILAFNNNPFIFFITFTFRIIPRFPKAYIMQLSGWKKLLTPEKFSFDVYYVIYVYLAFSKKTVSSFSPLARINITTYNVPIVFLLKLHAHYNITKSIKLFFSLLALASRPPLYVVVGGGGGGNAFFDRFVLLFFVVESFFGSV